MTSSTTSSREDALRRPTSDLYLTHTEILTGAQDVIGIPGVWSPRSDGLPGVHVALPGGMTVTVRRPTGDGRAAGTLDLAVDDIVVVDRHVTVAVEPDTEGQLWIRVLDGRSPRAAAFAGIESYPEDAGWRVPTTFVPDEVGGVTSFQRTLGGQRTFDYPRAGWLHTDVHGTEYCFEVAAFGPLFVMNFRDANAHANSGAGRILWLPGHPAELEHLDFNTAQLPPCAFNPLISCPIPPPGNRLAVEVRAGELRVRSSTDADDT